MKELQELRNEIIMLRNYGGINKEEELSLLSKLNSVKEQLNLSGVVKSLKNKEAISFKEWIKLNKHTDTYNDFLEGGFTYTLGDLYREYSKDETNL